MSRSPDSISTVSDDDVTGKRLTYERMSEERDRIRAARAFFARQLGPLPAFAGISVAVVGAFSEEIRNETWLWVALIAFAAMVAVSVFYSRMPAYRELRAQRISNNNTAEGDESMDSARWYQAEIDLERRIYTSQGCRGKFWWWPRRNLDGDLQEQLDKERLGVFLVQSLFLLVIAFLVFARFWS